MSSELKLVDPYTKEILELGKEYYIGNKNRYKIFDLINSRVKLVDFRPKVTIEHGAYRDGHSLKSLENIAPTNQPYMKNYKTKSFGEVLNFVDSPKILMDLGCANCEILNEFPPDLVKIGVDISSISMFSRIPNALDSNVDNLWLCDATKLPIPDDQKIDIILCCDILEHLLEPQKLLREIHRILNPKGIVIVTVPNLVHLGNRISMIIGCGAGIEIAQLLKLKNPVNPISGPRFPDQRLHLRWFTAKSLKQFLIQENFKIIKTFGCGPIVTRLRINHVTTNSALLTGIIATRK